GRDGLLRCSGVSFRGSAALRGLSKRRSRRPGIPDAALSCAGTKIAMIGLTSSSLRARAVAGVAVFFLVSCRVGPDYRPPALPEGAATPLVGVNAALETPTPPPDAWWHLYNDPHLDALVEEALKANRDLAAADANLTAARAAVAEVHARRYPSTDVTAAAVRGRDPGTNEILELTGRPPQTIWLYEDLFQVAYEVDLFGRIHRAIESANANAESVAAARDSVRVLGAANRARAHGAICALGEELGVARRSLAQRYFSIGLAGFALDSRSAMPA